MKCATIDLEHVLRESKPAAAAKARLAQEFGPKDQSLQDQWNQYALLEKRLQSALEAGNHNEAKTLGAERNALKTKLDLETTRFRAELAERRKQELDAVLVLVRDAYRSIASSEGYRVLYQTSQEEPAWVSPGTSQVNCPSRTDLTQGVMQRLSVEP